MQYIFQIRAYTSILVAMLACLLGGCETTKTIKVTENIVYTLGSIESIDRPMIRFADERSETQKSPSDLSNGLKIGDSQLDPPPPIIIRNAIERHLARANISDEVVGLLTAQTIGLVKFEVKVTGGNLVDGVTKHYRPEVMMVDTFIRATAQALVGSANIEVRLCISADDQQLCGWGDNTTTASLGKYSLEPAFKRAITSLIKEIEFASTRPEYGRR